MFTTSLITLCVTYMCIPIFVILKMYFSRRVYCEYFSFILIFLWIWLYGEF